MIYKKQAFCQTGKWMQRNLPDIKEPTGGNCLHYVLDMDFQEDRSTARKGKNTLSVLRKFAYNVVRLIQIKEPGDHEMVIDVLDEIADDFSVAARYLFSPIPSFY